MASSASPDNRNNEQKQATQALRLRLGSRLLADAFAGNGVLLLRTGNKVESASQLSRLLMLDVRFGPERSSEIPFDLENEAALDAVESAEEAGNTKFAEFLRRASILKAEVVNDVTDVFSRIRTTGKVDVGFAKSTVSTLIGDLLDDPRALVSLTQLKDADAYTFTHSVNVSILAIFLAMHAGMEKDIEEIGIGALLHDVGKLTIPLSILNKQGPLDGTEFKVMRQHPAKGRDVLVNSGGYSEIAVTCVLDHHEKLTGNGYPSGKRTSNIDRRAMITTLSDVYDALTTDRPYRRAMNPRDAMLLMTQQMGQDFDQHLLKKFVSLIGYFPVGSIVKLNSGYTAAVVSSNPDDPLRPMVQFTEDDRGKPVAQPKAVDLSEEKGVFITRFVKEHHAVDIVREAA